MIVMSTTKGGKQIAIRVSSDDLEKLNELVRRIIERSNGLADPDLAKIIRELAGLRKKKYLTPEDHEWIRSVRCESPEEQNDPGIGQGMIDAAQPAKIIGRRKVND